MEKSPQTINYAFYGRKSSEADDRQILSIDSQIESMSKVMNQEGVSISNDLMFTEAKSAKQPGRPVFNRMLEKIKRGEIQQIVYWKLDRLARNLADGGQIIQLLQIGLIQKIITYEKTYYPWDNVLMIAIEFGMANQSIRDLSVNVRRGFRVKYAMGYQPGVAKLGYINVPGRKGERVIGQDPERFDLVNQLWQKYLKGGCSVRQLLEYSDKELGIKTIQRYKEGGKPIHLSMLYTMLRTPFMPASFMVRMNRIK